MSPQVFRRATVLLALAIALSACSSSGNTEVIVSSEHSDSVQAPTPEATIPAGVAPTSEPAGQLAPPPSDTSLATGLVWTEIDLSDALGADEESTIRLESVGDGRVLALSFSDRGMDSVLVTENTTEWTPIPVPAGFLPWSVDITGDRWLIQGWDSTVEAPSAQVLFSDDEGASWTELVIDLDSFDGTAWIADAIVAGELIAVAVLRDSGVPLIEEGAEEAMDYGPSMSSVHIFLSDGGPVELVADFPGWFSGGYGASDGFHLIVSGPAGEDHLVSSPDGREWTTTTVDVEVTDSAGEMIWTTDPTEGKFKVERFVGVYGPEQVLTKPDGVSWVADLAVGPAGVAAVGGPELPYPESDGDIAMPSFSVEKDGFELRYNEPEGGITLWDSTEDSAVYVFDAETLLREGTPEVVQEVKGDDGSMLVVFEDPETGAELVTFSDEELAAAFVDADPPMTSEYNPNEFLIGWSVDGTDWDWQIPLEAFGLPEQLDGANSFTEIQVAVGQDFVLAQVQIFEFPPDGFDEDAGVAAGDGQPSALRTAPEISASPLRWFIAEVG